MAPTSSTTSPFGDLLRALRTRIRLTQQELAERAGLSTDAIGLLERGERRRPQRFTVERLADALDLAEADRQRFRTAADPSRVGPDTLRGLPAAPTPFLGRADEVATIGQVLGRPDVRLLTLTGPAGVGKTRLAVEAAGHLAAGFPDGIAFVPLAQVREPARVDAEIGRSLGLAEAPGQPLIQRIQDYLGPRRLLLLLDNFEHLLDVAPLIAGILAECPLIKVLTTSRMPLRLDAEHRIDVAPMPVPAHRSWSVDELATLPPVALFTYRACAVAPGFSVTAANAEAVVEICRRLDGLPLAIELAAAWLRVLSPAALLARLDTKLSLLVGGDRDLPARQQTLRNALMWSYELLTPREQGQFARLSVFRDGCTPEAAEAVAGTDLIDVTSLADRSLLIADAGRTEPRFHMLETVRDFAAEMLAAGGETAAIQDRHTRYYLSLAQSADLVGPAELLWKARFSDDDANLRSAVQAALDAEDAGLAVEFAHALWRYWATRGQTADGARWLERTLQLSGNADLPVPPLRRAELLLWTATMARLGGDLIRATELYDACVATGGNIGDELVLAAARHGLGMVSHEEGDLVAATAHFTEAVRICRRHESSYGTGSVLKSLGDAKLAADDLVGATNDYRESSVRFAELGHRWGVVQALTCLGHVALQQGDDERAIEHYRESLGLSSRLGDPIVVADSLEGLAQAMCRQSYRASARLLGASDALRQRTNTSRNERARSAYERTLVTIRAALGQSAFDLAWVDGAALSFEQVLELAVEPDAD